MAVNISSLQFRRGGLEEVKAALNASGLPAECLDGADQAIELIDQPKALGVHVALNDFDTGSPA
ncbi:hypothetical protein ACFFU2_08300 [Halomonas alkalicola]|uniref:EAL domain-containing protein n=1 Tax=Halomonas alkalicola TaxID=1930622 RepID=A0ABY9H546_9GAMM|nr:hypothetical protein [Halomonas alkalicola]WLI73435.1 hypothetical protein B6N23_00320 [Halomonas alkalicola]